MEQLTLNMQKKHIQYFFGGFAEQYHIQQDGKLFMEELLIK